MRDLLVLPPHSCSGPSASSFILPELVKWKELLEFLLHKEAVSDFDQAQPLLLLPPSPLSVWKGAGLGGWKVSLCVCALMTVFAHEGGLCASVRADFCNFFFFALFPVKSEKGMWWGGGARDELHTGVAALIWKAEVAAGIGCSRDFMITLTGPWSWTQASWEFQSGRLWLWNSWTQWPLTCHVTVLPSQTQTSSVRCDSAVIV